MDLNFFKQTRILDGGMGQELLARGMEPNGTLWSANALLQEKYHQLLLDTHLDFIKAGAEVIVTTTFTTRKIRLRDNNVEDKFEYLNNKAGEIAQKAKKAAANVTIIITFLRSYMSDNFPIGHCDIAPDIASKNVTKEIWKIEKFIVVAYTASNVNNADCMVP